MTTQYKVRVLSVMVLACAAGLFLFNSVNGGTDNPVLTACIDAKDKPTRIETCTKALELDDLHDRERGDAAFYLARAVAYDDAERARANGYLDNIDDAFVDIETVFEMGENSAWAWYWRGRLHEEIDNRKAAFADFHESLTIKPHYCRSIWAMKMWSNTLLEMVESQPLPARDIVDDILAEHPENLRLLHLRFRGEHTRRAI